ncbi:hypothetical protein THAOC_00950, partial [Thalassiosira oceanica]
GKFVTRNGNVTSDSVGSCAPALDADASTSFDGGCSQSAPSCDEPGDGDGLRWGAESRDEPASTLASNGAYGASLTQWHLSDELCHECIDMLRANSTSPLDSELPSKGKGKKSKQDDNSMIDRNGNKVNSDPAVEAAKDNSERTWENVVQRYSRRNMDIPALRDLNVYKFVATCWNKGQDYVPMFFGFHDKATWPPAEQYSMWLLAIFNEDPDDSYFLNLNLRHNDPDKDWSINYDSCPSMRLVQYSKEYYERQIREMPENASFPEQQILHHLYHKYLNDQYLETKATQSSERNSPTTQPPPSRVFLLKACQELGKLSVPIMFSRYDPLTTDLITGCTSLILATIGLWVSIALKESSQRPCQGPWALDLVNVNERRA